MTPLPWLLLLAGCAPLCGDLELIEQRECSVEALIEVIDEGYPQDFIDRKGLDMPAIYAGWRALPEAHGGAEGFGEALSRAMAALMDAHTGITRSTLYVPPHNELHGHLIDGELVIARSSVQSSLEPGDVVLSIDDVPFPELWEGVEPHGSTQAGRDQRRVEVLLDTLGPEPTSLTVRRGEETRGAATWLLGTRELDRGVFGEWIGGAWRLRVDSFDEHETLSQLDALIDEGMGADAVILDLRGNGGGYAWLADALLARFFEEPPPDYPVLDKDGLPTRLSFSVPRRGDAEVYTGPVAVLIDGGSISGANYVAYRMQRHGRGLVCGTHSGGGSGLNRQRGALAPGVAYAVVDAYMVDDGGGDIELGVAPDPQCAVSWTQAQLKSALDLEPGVPRNDLALQLALRALAAQ